MNLMTAVSVLTGMTPVEDFEEALEAAETFLADDVAVGTYPGSITQTALNIMAQAGGDD